MEIWFDPQTAGKIGAMIGGALGLIGTLMGCSCGICVRKGWKKFALTIFTIAIAASVLLIITGIIAAANKQPYHVWYTFFFPGFIGTVIFSSLFPVVRKRFLDAEMRQMQAKDL
ncbi:MAG: hypothetical protein WC770_05350 [Phycisphaerae bacterium]|jgi:cell shape-determining protein MreD